MFSPSRPGLFVPRGMRRLSPNKPKPLQLGPQFTTTERALFAFTFKSVHIEFEDLDGQEWSRDRLDESSRYSLLSHNASEENVTPSHSSALYGVARFPSRARGDQDGHLSPSSFKDREVVDQRSPTRLGFNNHTSFNAADDDLSPPSSPTKLPSVFAGSSNLLTEEEDDDDAWTPPSHVNLPSLLPPTSAFSSESPFYDEEDDEYMAPPSPFKTPLFFPPRPFLETTVDEDADSEFESDLGTAQDVRVTRPPPTTSPTRRIFPASISPGRMISVAVEDWDEQIQKENVPFVPMDSPSKFKPFRRVSPLGDSRQGNSPAISEFGVGFGATVSGKKRRAATENPESPYESDDSVATVRASSKRICS